MDKRIFCDIVVVSLYTVVFITESGVKLWASCMVDELTALTLVINGKNSITIPLNG